MKKNLVCSTKCNNFDGTYNLTESNKDFDNLCIFSYTQGYLKCKQSL